MTWVEDAVRDFGRNMGLDGLAFRETVGAEARGVIHLRIGEADELLIERRPTALSICLARRLAHASPAQLRKALMLCHFRAGAPLPTAVGLRGDDVLVFVTRVPEAEVTLPVLQQTVERLMALHDQVTA